MNDTFRMACQGLHSGCDIVCIMHKYLPERISSLRRRAILFVEAAAGSPGGRTSTCRIQQLWASSLSGVVLESSGFETVWCANTSKYASTPAIVFPSRSSVGARLLCAFWCPLCACLMPLCLSLAACHHIDSPYTTAVHLRRVVCQPATQMMSINRLFIVFGIVHTSIIC